MMETSMKYNGSGYYDETPWKASMQMAKPGEIWTSNTGKEFLILKNHGTLCSVLHLLDRAPRNSTDSIEVACKALRWTNPCMIVYLFNQSLGEYIETVATEQFEGIMQVVADRLGVKIAVQKVEAPAQELEEAQKRAETLYQAMEKMQVKHACEMERLEKALAESKEACGTAVLACSEYEKRIMEMESRPQVDPAAAVYKQLYHELLDKIIAGGGLK